MPRTFCAHDRLVGLAQRQGPGDVTGVEARDLAAKEDAQSRESTKEHSRAHPEKMQTLENQGKDHRMTFAMLISQVISVYGHLLSAESWAL